MPIIKIKQPSTIVRFLIASLLVAAFCSGGAAEPSKAEPRGPKASRKERKERKMTNPAPVSAPAPGDATPAPPEASAKNNCVLEAAITDAVGGKLASRIDLLDQSGRRCARIELPAGQARAEAPQGTFKAFIYVYALEVPVLVTVQDITTSPNAPARLEFKQAEGTSGNMPLFAFDKDHDFALDKAEIKCGTKPDDATSVPGRRTLSFNPRVFSKEARWYRGDLHAHSKYGGGKETVAELVRRAEREGLDFLAITDRNTVAACDDPGFKSDSVVLIPAMEWGSDEQGVALLYGMRTFPEYTPNRSQAQALVDLVQAQGGFYAVAHPCFPTAPWKWGLSYVNGVEVWCRGWRDVPPMSLDALPEALKTRDNGKLVQSIAFAAASANLPEGLAEALKTDEGLVRGVTSANGQAMTFYDSELVRGVRAAAIGGSGSSSPEVPLGAPVTYVYGAQKSLQGVLLGMLEGRTYVSSGLKGPRLSFRADVLKDDKPDAIIGGVIPLDVPTRFEVIAENAQGNQLQVLLNGRPLISKSIESNSFILRFEERPVNYAVYRVCITARPAQPGFGNLDVLALSSPIYAQTIDVKDPKLEQFRKQQKKEAAATGQQALLPTSPAPAKAR